MRYFNHRFNFRHDRSSGVQLTSWKDNKTIHIASTAAGAEPLTTVKRYFRKEHVTKTIPCPQSVKLYNKTMGGVDRSDQNVSTYPTSIRGKKWYYPIFLHLLDLTLVNSWILFRLICSAKGENSPDLLGFKISVAKDLLARGRSLRSIPKSLSSELRYDGLHHIVVPSKVNRCAHCSRNTSFKCKKCNRNLHPKCFESYHSP